MSINNPFQDFTQECDTHVDRGKGFMIHQGATARRLLVAFSKHGSGFAHGNVAEIKFSSTEKILTAVQTAVAKERPLAQGKRIIIVTPIPALEAVTKASIPNAKALHPRWIQWVNSLAATDVVYEFDPNLKTQEFLQYEYECPLPIEILPFEEYGSIIYTDGSAQPAVGGKQAYSAACAIVKGRWHNGKFRPLVTKTQSLGDCSAQRAELVAFKMALENSDREFPTLIVCDSFYCVQSYNEYLQNWVENGFKDAKGGTIKHKMLWEQVVLLQKELQKTHVIHTLSHQRDGVHVAGNSLADEAAKAAVQTASVAAITRSQTKIDSDILQAVSTSVKNDKKTLPKGFPKKYLYLTDTNNVPFARIPGVGDRVIPNREHRLGLIKAAHEGLASAHAGVSATISLLKQRYWWPRLRIQTKKYVLECDICQRIKVSTVKRPVQTPLLISDKPFACVYLDHCGPLERDGNYRYIMVAVDSYNSAYNVI
ncbi:uncharacterized protein LOC144804770 [Lissotriton helveticus]